MTGKGAGGEAASWRPPASEKEEAMPRGVGKGVCRVSLQPRTGRREE